MQLAAVSQELIGIMLNIKCNSLRICPLLFVLIENNTIFLYELSFKLVIFQATYDEMEPNFKNEEN